jgi:serine/threonine protein kinase
MRCRIKNLYNMQTALRWAAQVAAALALLHEQQPAYIHGDVKADNIFLTDDSDVAQAQAKIGDLKPHRYCLWTPSWLGRECQ